MRVAKVREAGNRPLSEHGARDGVHCFFGCAMATPMCGYARYKPSTHRNGTGNHDRVVSRGLSREVGEGLYSARMAVIQDQGLVSRRSFAAGAEVEKSCICKVCVVRRQCTL